MANLTPATGAEAGLTVDQHIRPALDFIAKNDGIAQMKDLYPVVEAILNSRGYTFSEQGRATFRALINSVAVKAGYLYPHDKASPGWKITPEGREFISTPEAPPETVTNVDSGIDIQVESSSARGAAFEIWALSLLRAWYPYYSWYHQGNHKRSERGLDFVGTRIGDANGESRCIGVQVKCHAENNAPSQLDWLKFLSGCFARRVDAAIFITTGRLTSEQRRESQECNVIVVEGNGELERLAKQFNVDSFKSNA